MKTADIPQVGIGLAFCKMVVEAHGGTISVNDNQPQGAVFTVEL
jgi:signal transduction histidine kinase